MLLRRIIEHVKTQNWTAVAIDFFIVVVGVFIGIQVSNWNTGLSNKRAYESALERLRLEIDTNDKTLTLVESEVKETRDQIRKAQEALATCGDDPQTRELVNDGIRQLTSTSGLHFRHRAIDELTSSPPLLEHQSSTARQRFADLVFYMELAMLEGRFSENMPLESAPQQISILALGPRETKKGDYFGIDWSKEGNALLLAVPVSAACKDNALIKAFWTWEKYQSNLPIHISKMRQEYRDTLAVVERELSR